MRTKVIMGFIVLVALSAGTYTLIRHSKISTAIEPPVTTQTIPKWTFEKVGADKAAGGDRTKVTFTFEGKSYDVGIFTGTCSEITAKGGIDGTSLLPKEISGVQCLFAGGGQEIGLFEKDGVMSLERGDRGEPQADGRAALRGNFTSFMELGQ